MQRWPEVCAKLARSSCEVCAKLARSSCEVGLKLVRSWLEVCAKLAQSSCEVLQRSSLRNVNIIFAPTVYVSVGVWVLGLGCCVTRYVCEVGSAVLLLFPSALQEFLAFGFMNFLGSLFGAIPTSGNFSRTLLQLSFGGNTQVL